MKTKIFFLFLCTLIGCSNSQLERVFSPSGIWILEVEQDVEDDDNHDGILVLKLVDRDGVVKNILNTDESSASKWAVGWYNDWTIILVSDNDEVHVWTISEQSKFTVLDNVSEEMEQFGRAVLQKKYGM